MADYPLIMEVPFFNDGGTVIIDSSRFSNNSGMHGGAIYNDRGTLTITNSIISDNKGTWGGGIV